MKTFAHVHPILTLCLLLLASCKRQPALPGPPQTAKSDEKVNETSRPNAFTNDSNQVNGPHQYLELIVQNNTSADIDDVGILLSKEPCTFGVVGQGSSAGYLGWRRPVGTNAVVQWKDSRQIKNEVRVDISTTYIPDAPGQLTFTITGTNVAVAFHKLNRKQ